MVRLERPEHNATGNFCLDRYLAARPQPFLRRNLRRILDAHQRDLEIPAPEMPSGDAVAGAEANDPRLLDVWNGHRSWEQRRIVEVLQPPATAKTVVDSRNDLRRSTRTGHNIRLSIKTIVIKLTDRRGPASAGRNAGPDWSSSVPASSTQLASCRAQIRVRGVTQDPVDVLGEISARHGALYITFQDDFDVPVRNVTGARQLLGASDVRLQVTVESSALEGFVTGSLAMQSQGGLYALTSTISTQLPSPIDFRIIHKDLSAACVNDSQVAQHKPHVQMEIAYTWHKMPWHSPLAACAVSLRPLRARPLQLPTPDASQDARFEEPRPVNFEITYIFMNARKLVQRDLDCPLCQRNLAFTNFSRLHLHLRLHHDYFEFKVSDDDPVETDPVSHIVIMDVATEANGRMNGFSKDEVLIDWIAPKQPFNEKAYLRGQTSAWTQKLPAAKRFADEHVSTESTYTRVPPEEVMDLEMPKLPLHSVPIGRHEDTHYYRTGSKKRVEPGDLIDESDNDLDEDWLIEKTKQELKYLRRKAESGSSEPLTAIQQNFMLAWNTHHARETRLGKNGMRFKRDSVIRFARRHQHKLRDDTWKLIFDQQLRFLERMRVIQAEDINYCLSLDGRDASSPKGKEVVTTSSVVGDLCSRCGQTNSGVRDIIYCSNEECAYGGFHMHCYGLKTRPEDWWCPDCMLPTSSGD